MGSRWGGHRSGLQGASPHLSSSGVLSELHAGTALASHISLQEAGLLSQLDLMSSRPGTMCCSPEHPPSSAQQIRGALQGEGGASGLPWRAEKFALYKQTQFRRPPLTKPCVLAWLHLSRERGRFSSQQRHFLLSQAPGACICLRGASFELAQRHREHSPGPGSLAWHSFRQL